MKHSTSIFKILAACVLAGVLLLFGLQHVVLASREFDDVLQPEVELFADEVVAFLHALCVFLGVLILLL